MFKLSYSCNSAELLPIETVCEQLQIDGYSGVELSFQREQFDPENITPERIHELAEYFKTSAVKPVCISTATTKFLSETPHEPSLINLNLSERARRAALITKGIQLAAQINIPLVSFQSGYVRDEQAHLSYAKIMTILAEEIKALIKKTPASVKLVLEPEPGMFIETIEDATTLIQQVDSDQFGLHLDIGHVFCSEENYVEAIRTHGKNALYMHMADIKEGFNLKYIACTEAEIIQRLSKAKAMPEATLFDIDGKSSYVYSANQTHYLLRSTSETISEALNQCINTTLTIDEAFIATKESKMLKLEIAAYLDSIAGVSYARALKAYHAVATLRLGTIDTPPKIEQVVCNTLKGKVHYHDLFGSGNIDYPAVLSALIESGFNGYCTVELYNHATLWRRIAPSSAKYICAAMTQHYGWHVGDFGHIDHRTVTPPYIRVADTQLGPNGDLSMLYDFRLCKPNQTALPVTTLHSLEHALLAILPKLLPGFLTVAPMGCRTGMYITTACPLSKTIVEQALQSALEAICALDVVPYQSDKTCGMWEDHDLKAAQEVATNLLNALPFNAPQALSKRSNEVCIPSYES